MSGPSARFAQEIGHLPGNSPAEMAAAACVLTAGGTSEAEVSLFLAIVDLAPQVPVERPRCRDQYGRAVTR